MKTKLLLIALIVGTLWISSCTKYPADVTRTQEDLAVLSQWDTKKDFSTYNTFLIPDSLYYKDGNDSGYVSNAKSADIINQIVKNMTDRGYVRVYKPTKPDIGISATYIKNVNVDVYYPYYPYWGYWGGYYPYYWYGYGYPYVTSYSVGTVIIDMVDLENSTGNKLEGIWTGVIRGLFTGTHTTTEINNTIDQAFNQSLCFTSLN